MVYLVIEVHPEIFGFFVGFLYRKLVKVPRSLPLQIRPTSKMSISKVKSQAAKKAEEDIPRTFCYRIL